MAERVLAGRLVLLGAVAAPHGVRGLVKLKAFTERPEDLVAYGPLSDAAGRRSFRVSLKGKAGGGLLLAAIEGVDTREAAEALRGTELYIDREKLPPPEDEEAYYWADLEGLEAVTAAGDSVGTVQRVLDYGAGAVLQISKGGGGELLLPFVEAFVPEVDLDGGRVVVVPPEEVVAGSGPEGGEST